METTLILPNESDSIHDIRIYFEDDLLKTKQDKDWVYYNISGAKKLRDFLNQLNLGE